MAFPAMDQKKQKLEENGVNEVEKEDVKKLMDILSQEQLLEILQNAAISHEDVLDEIRKHADKDPAHRKIFVRGLGWDTTAETLKNVFSQNGEVDEAIVIKDKATGKSRGFGFVTFRHMDGALCALKDPSKKIEGRMTICQLASAGPSAGPLQKEDSSDRKIFIGNVPQEFPPDKLLSFFSQFGEIAEGPLGYDKTTGKSRGFALIIFKSAEAAQQALQEPVKAIDGHQVVCKAAVMEAQHQKQSPMTALQEGADAGKFAGFGSQYGSAPMQGGPSLQFGQANRTTMMPGQSMPQALNSNLGQNAYRESHTGIGNQNQSLGYLDVNPNPQFTNSPNTLGTPHQNFPLGSQHGQANSQHDASRSLQPQMSTRGGAAGYSAQAPGAAGYAAQAPGGPYDSQISAQNGQSANYYSSHNPSFYGSGSSMPLPSVGVPVHQGAGAHFLMGSYPNAQQLPSSAPRTQVAGQPPNMPAYF